MYGMMRALHGSKVASSFIVLTGRLAARTSLGLTGCKLVISLWIEVVLWEFLLVLVCQTMLQCFWFSQRGIGDSISRCAFHSWMRALAERIEQIWRQRQAEVESWT